MRGRSPGRRSGALGALRVGAGDRIMRTMTQRFDLVVAGGRAAVAGPMPRAACTARRLSLAACAMRGLSNPAIAPLAPARLADQAAA